MIEHSAVVLGGILPNRKDLLGAAILQLSPELFTNEVHKNIFKLLDAFYHRAGGVMSTAFFTKALEDTNQEAAKILSYTQIFKSLVDMNVPEPDFRWALSELKVDYSKRQTGIVITTGMEILERGYEVGREFLTGHEDARAYIASELHRIDRQGTAEAAPEGNIFTEAELIMQEYVARRDSDVALGVMTGISSIDLAFGGFQRGELCLICGYTGQGKSQLTTQTAWNAAVKQKKNVMFATSETIRGTAIRRVLARHSLEPQFNYPKGINSSDLKKGTLTREEEKVFAAVLDDWTNNPEYGVLNIVQIPRGATLDYVEQRLRQMGQESGCDLVLEDYLALLAAEGRHDSEREKFNEILRNAKGIAVGFNNGEGVPFVSPWALKQDAFKEALKNNGRYTLTSLSDTSEAEKSPDTILTVFRDPDNYREMLVQFLKMRDEALPAIQTVEINFRSTYIGDSSSASSFGLEGNNDNSDLMDMLGA